MSELDKPAVAKVPAADSESSQLEGTGGGDVAEKSAKNENGIEPTGEREEGGYEKKEKDVKMEDAADNEGTVEEESTKGKDVEEEEPMKEEVKEEENKEHKDGEAIEENDDEAMEKGEEAEEKGKEGEEKTEETEEKVMRKKRTKKLTSHESGEKDEKTIKKRGRKAKEILSTPIASSIDRPVRERKTVERLVETLRKEPSKALLIEKGRGTPLKDIPNVAYKLSKKKPGDIRSLHLLLFGRKGKATHYKSHIFQFSGFVWHDNEEKQRAKVKEKLDKCVKDKLLDFCDVFDIPVSRATSRKEDLVEKLLDFMVSPHATTDVILAEKDQSSKSRKRKSRGRVSRTAATPRKQLRKKRTKGEYTLKSEKSPNETEDEDGDGNEDEEGHNEDGVPDEDEAIKHSEDEEDNESEHHDLEEEYSRRGRQNPKSKRRGSSAKASKKSVTPEKASPAATVKSPTRTFSKRKADEDKNTNEKTLLKKKKEVVTPRKKISSPKPDTKEKKTTGKKAGRGKPKSDQAAANSGPTEDDLRKTICKILKEVDFNTATFTDILKKLASHYDMDLTARKASIKLMIQDELTKLADEAEDEDDDEDESEKDGDPEPAAKKVEA